MIIHVLLLLACAPLMVIGWPHKTNTHPIFLRKTYHFLLKHPLFCWITGIGMMWFWHIPSILKGLMISHQQDFSFLILAHIGSLLIAGIIFTWPIVNPQRSFRIYPPLGIVYLFTACIACSLLGLLITFAPTGIYSHHMSVVPSTIVQDFSLIDSGSDQQAAGLIMWVPCCFVYLFGVLYLLFKWLKKPIKLKKPIQKTFSHSELLIPESHD
jgi:cytochrome c oxidase assembly factor CtaG